MTKKKTEGKTSKKNNSTPVKAKKIILYEAVQKNETPNYIIIGALSKAGLLTQYEYEKSVYGKEDLEPTITLDELKQIIKNF